MIFFFAGGGGLLKHTKLFWGLVYLDLDGRCCECVITKTKSKKLCGLKATKFPYYLHPKFINFYLTVSMAVSAIAMPLVKLRDGELILWIYYKLPLLIFF